MVYGATLWKRAHGELPLHWWECGERLHIVYSLFVCSLVGVADYPGRSFDLLRAINRILFVCEHMFCFVVAISLASW